MMPWTSTLRGNKFSFENIIDDKHYFSLMPPSQQAKINRNENSVSKDVVRYFEATFDDFIKKMDLPSLFNGIDPKVIQFLNMASIQLHKWRDEDYFPAFLFNTIAQEDELDSANNYFFAVPTSMKSYDAYQKLKQNKGGATICNKMERAAEKAKLGLRSHRILITPNFSIGSQHRRHYRYNYASFKFFHLTEGGHIKLSGTISKDLKNFHAPGVVIEMLASIISAHEFISYLGIMHSQTEIDVNYYESLNIDDVKAIFPTEIDTEIKNGGQLGILIINDKDEKRIFKI